MTYEEKIKDAIGCIKRHRRGLSDYNGDWSFFDTAIEALEMRTPKKPKDKFTVPYDTLACGICPYCGEGVNSDMKFCSECGQRLNWSNDEET